MHTVVRVLFAALQKVCGATMSTNGATEVRVGGEKGRGKPETKKCICVDEENPKLT